MKTRFHLCLRHRHTGQLIFAAIDVDVLDSDDDGPAANKACLTAAVERALRGVSFPEWALNHLCGCPVPANALPVPNPN